MSMNLHWRRDSADSMARTMFREGQQTSNRALRHMRRVSHAVLITAIKYSPVDYKGKTRNSEPLHELEKSHRLVEKYGDHRRLEASIEVGGMVGDVNVDLYAMWIHDGSYERGPATIAKGPKAGPGWLDTALKEFEGDFDDALLDELMEGLMR